MALCSPGKTIGTSKPSSLHRRYVRLSPTSGGQSIPPGPHTTRPLFQSSALATASRLSTSCSATPLSPTTPCPWRRRPTEQRSHFAHSESPTRSKHSTTRSPTVLTHYLYGSRRSNEA